MEKNIETIIVGFRGLLEGPIPCRVWGFRVFGLGFRIQGLGFRVDGIGSRVYGDLAELMGAWDNTGSVLRAYTGW